MYIHIVHILPVLVIAHPVPYGLVKSPRSSKRPQHNPKIYLFVPNDLFAVQLRLCVYLIEYIPTVIYTSVRRYTFRISI